MTEEQLLELETEWGSDKENHPSNVQQTDSVAPKLHAFYGTQEEEDDDDGSVSDPMVSSSQDGQGPFGARTTGTHGHASLGPNEPAPSLSEQSGTTYTSMNATAGSSLSHQE